MALILTFGELEQSESKLHLPAEARYKAYKTDGKTFLQINTYGRPDRQIPGKVSQSIQLDETSARQLLKIIKSEFNFD